MFVPQPTLLAIAVVLLAVPFSAAISDYGDETKISWSDYPQAAFMADANGNYFLGFWVSKKLVVGHVYALPLEITGFQLFSGDIVNAPMTHDVVRVYIIDDTNAGQVVVFKVCNPPKRLAPQSLNSAAYWDYDSTNTSGTFIYAKNPSKELYTRSAGNIPKKSDCLDALAMGECDATKTLQPHQICADWDPQPDACQHLVAEDTQPWLLIDGKMQAIISKYNCKSDGSSLSGPILTSIRFSLTAIKTAVKI